jgi:hypothetical protein
MPPKPPTEINITNLPPPPTSTNNEYHTALTTPIELIEFDSSFWNIAPRWISDIQRELSWSETDVVCAADEEESSNGSVDDEKGRSWKSIRVVRTVWMAAILITGLVLLVQLSKTRHVKLEIGNVLFRSGGYSHRYIWMKERLVNVSDARVLEEESSPQHRALVFLAEDDPLMLVSRVEFVLSLQFFQV